MVALAILAGILFPVLVWLGLFVAIRRPAYEVVKRVGTVSLAIVTGILFPVMIWVGLFTAIRRPLLQAMKRAGATALALLSGVFFPVLIWAGLVAATRELFLRWIRMQREAARTVGEILASAGISMQPEIGGNGTAVALVFAPRPISEIRELLVTAGL